MRDMGNDFCPLNNIESCDIKNISIRMDENYWVKLIFHFDEITVCSMFHTAPCHSFYSYVKNIKLSPKIM